MVGPQLGMAADMPFGRPRLGAPQTRLLTRHLEEVWFLGHACHALVASLFTSLFAGKREVARASGALRAPRSDMGTLRDRAASHYDLDPGLQKRVAAPCSNLGPTGGPTALPTGSASCFITHSRRIRVEGPTFQPVRSATPNR